MELILLVIFAAALLGCVFTGASLLAALVLGYCLFFGYGIAKGKTCYEMLTFSAQGIKTVRNILITFLLIGLITAVWRAGGSIAFIVYHATALCTPSLMVLATFLLCCGISFLTGTAFGSAATMGVICAAMAGSLGVPVFWTGGAVLAGVFFGDRCSPVSTSALLVSELTGTNLFDNLKRMAKSALVPFLLSCAIYWQAGRGITAAQTADTTRAVFAANYSLSLWTLLPVAVVLVFAAFRMNVKLTLAVSALCGLGVTVLVQGIPLTELPMLCINGFHPADPALNDLMAGGGICSMVRVFCIVCLSSCYSGMFRGTGFLNRIEAVIRGMNRKLTPFGTTLLTAVITAVIACNQTLAIMLTNQLCGSENPDKNAFALDLENSAVVVAPLVPWSIAGAVPLASVGAPTVCILGAVYLWLLPMWHLAVRLWEKKRA